MTDSNGVNALTGKSLNDWAHVEQSIQTILTTRIGSRIMRRDFGSLLPDLVDSKMYQRNVLALYSAAALAILAWEPRFRVSGARIQELTIGGRAALEVLGTYFPRGHKGDYSIAENATTRVVFAERV